MQFSLIRTYEYKHVRLFIVAQVAAAFVLIRYGIIYVTHWALVPYSSKVYKDVYGPGGLKEGSLSKFTWLYFYWQLIPLMAGAAAILLLTLWVLLFRRKIRREYYVVLVVVVGVFLLLALGNVLATWLVGPAK